MNSRRLVPGAVPLLLVLALLLPRAGLAGEPAIEVELNNAQQTGNNCTLSFVFNNGLTGAIDNLSLEVVLFDKAGLVDKFLRLKTGALAKAKTRVKQFALNGRACGDISRILINDVPECKGADLSPSVCLGALKPSSRTAIKLSL